MERSELACPTQVRYASRSKTKWRRSCLPRMSIPERMPSPLTLSVVQDLGNTNFSIHLPRTSFDRRATVLRAVRSLGVDDAHVNDRNDICVGEYKMSLLPSDPSRPGLPLMMKTRLWICVQNRKQSRLPPRHHAHLDAIGSSGRTAPTE
jgi:hypothetical protein